MKKKLFAVSGVVLGGAVALFPINGLSDSAVTALGILVWAIVWWVGQVLPDFITALLMAVLFVTTADVPTGIVFSAFSNSSWWLLLAAFGLSLGVTKSGLMKRISLYVLRVFPGNFIGQVLGLITVGTVTAPFIPSMSAKAAMLSPLALGISQSMGYEDYSKESSGLFLAMLTGLRNPGPLLISASVIGYAILGQFPTELSKEYTMLSWFLCALPWFICVTALNLFALILFFRPLNDVTKRTDDFGLQIADLGPMGVKEKYMLLIVVATMAMWVMEGVHGIPSHISAILALCLTIAGNVYDRQAFKAELNWDSIVFVGVVLGLATVFSHLGINAWIVEICSSMFMLLSKNALLLVLGVGLLTVLLRFVIVSELAFVNIFLVFAVPLTVSLGINPWIIGFAVYALVNPWFFMYQNPVYMAAFYAMDGKMIHHSTAAKYCFIYILICLLALLVSVPYWTRLGVFYL